MKRIVVIAFIFLVVYMSIILATKFYSNKDATKDPNIKKNLKVINKDKEENKIPKINELPNKSTSEFDLKADDYQIAGVSLGYSMEKVLEVLGEPIEKKRETGPHFNDKTLINNYEWWIYNDLKIMFYMNSEEKGKVVETYGGLFYISVSSDKYSSFRGIKVGDSLEDVFRKYGETNPYEDNYGYVGDLDEVSFNIRDGKVIEIIIRQFFD